MSKAKDFHELTPAELGAKIHDLRDELFTLRTQLATGQLENTARVRETRRDIARCKTILRAKLA